MRNDFIKPYDPGYGAPMTDDIDRQAILDMEEGPQDLQSADFPLDAPPFITLRLEVKNHLYEGNATMERVVNGQSAGVTPLYQPGPVLCDGSENLKPFSKLRAVDFIYHGRGFYWDDEDRRQSFYPGHVLTTLIQGTVGRALFQKPFAGQAGSLRLETSLKRQERDEWTDVAGYGRDTYPVYPYGGYSPPQGNLEEVEPVYAFPAVDQASGKSVTALKLYRTSFFHQRGGFPPTPFTMDHKKWVFPHQQSALELITVGQALRGGYLTFSVKTEAGDVYTYASYGYEQVRGDMTQIHVHCERR